MSAPRIFKYEVPVDDRVHRHELTGPILHVGLQRPGVVTFWAMHHDSIAVPWPGEFVVIGTGHPLRADMMYVGTVLDGSFVWHLLKRHPFRG